MEYLKRLRDLFYSRPPIKESNSSRERIKGYNQKTISTYGEENCNETDPLIRTGSSVSRLEIDSQIESFLRVRL